MVTPLSASNRFQLALSDSKALAFNDGDVGVMSEPVQQSGDAGGVSEDIIPVFECSVGCDQQGRAFVAAIDHFVKQVGGAWIVGEITHFINAEQAGLGVEAKLAAA